MPSPILKPLSGFKVGDIVCIAKDRFAFGDHEIVKEDEEQFVLRRPYIDPNTKEARYEETTWAKDCKMKFQLVGRYSS